MSSFMRNLYRNGSRPATAAIHARIPFGRLLPGCAVGLSLLLSAASLAGCNGAAAPVREGELTGREKIEMRDELRAAPGHAEQRQIVNRYQDILRRREEEMRLGVEPSAPPPPVFPRPLDNVPAVDERELGGILKQRGQ